MTLRMQRCIALDSVDVAFLEKDVGQNLGRHKLTLIFMTNGRNESFYLLDPSGLAIVEILAASLTQIHGFPVVWLSTLRLVM